MNPDYFIDCFKQYIKEYDTNIIIPCHFIIQKLPTILIFHLLEKSSVILTGKRMGGVITSSLAFYIMYVGKSMNINYNNAFQKSKKKSIGVVTFGSPSFLSNLTVGVKMKKLTSYFYHVKEEFDYIPEIIDFISKDKLLGNITDNSSEDKLFKIFNNIEFDSKQITLLNDYLTRINFTEDKLKLCINKFIGIPFGYYFRMKDCSLISISEYNFTNFYYFNKFKSNQSISHLKVYKKLASEEVIFSKKYLEYLESKDYKLEIMKIIRRNRQSKSKKSDRKAIIKFELIKSYNNNIITPDIIKKITLFPYIGQEIIISNENIYYDNDTDITAYIDTLNENVNIKSAIITNQFSGEIQIKYVLNILGSGPTGDMIYTNLEKLFLIPFFKLFEIFYFSCKNEGKYNKEEYNKLKEENFGKNFEGLKILKPFEKQIKTFNELLFFTRPDIIANKEKKFIEQYVTKELKKLDLTEKDTNNIINNLNDNLRKYYEQAKKLQVEQAFNCIDSEPNSLAKKVSFPQHFENKEEQKLFMCKLGSFWSNNIISQKFDDSYIKNFFLEKYMIEVLKNIEIKIENNNNNIKDYLNKNIGNYYNLFIVPKILFLRMIILTSIEGGDIIKFYHNLNWRKFLSHIGYSPIVILNLIPKMRNEFYEKDFEKIFTKDKIEEIHMKNIFCKKK